jgi:hypothetical protein
VLNPVEVEVEGEEDLGQVALGNETGDALPRAAW